MPSVLRRLLACSFALLLAACGNPGGSADAPKTRNTALDNLFPMEQAVGSQAAFFVSLYRQMDDEPNFVVSPYGISAVLTHLAVASGNEQLAVALRHPTSSEKLPRTYGLITESLPFDAEVGVGIPSVENRIWAAEGENFAPAFLESDAAYRLHAANGAVAGADGAATLRDWLGSDVPGYTPGNGNLLLGTRARLDGPFLKPFVARLTQPKPFRVTDKITVETPLTRTVDSYQVTHSHMGVDVVEVPYVGDELALVLIVPRETTDLDTVAAALPDSLPVWMNRLSEGHVDLQIPKCTLTTNLDLGRVLQALGAEDAFRADAGLPGVLESGPAALAGVFHHAEINFGEYGSNVTEPSPDAAPRLQGTRSRLFVQVPAERPFLFVVRDMRRGAWLLAGRIADPRKF